MNTVIERALYRGKDSGNQWRYGSLIRYPVGGIVIAEINEMYGCLKQFKVDFGTVGQWTGLICGEDNLFAGDFVEFDKI